mmetsp:Transcript_38019/g.98153  ORF Transcript_38019/g.98153 Transcript_38019/m.98153 type:complete len:141 (-) Transcript_38019:3635-4057(-)
MEVFQGESEIVREWKFYENGFLLMEYLSCTENMPCFPVSPRAKFYSVFSQYLRWGDDISEEIIVNAGFNFGAKLTLELIQELALWDHTALTGRHQGRHHRYLSGAGGPRHPLRRSRNLATVMRWQYPPLLTRRLSPLTLQ